MDITINRWKYKDGVLEIGYTKKDDPGQCDETFGAKPHTDLISAIQRLVIHWAVLVYYVDPASIPDIAGVSSDVTKDMKVSSCSISGDDGKQNVTICGQRKVANNRWVNINTPPRMFAENEATRYQYMDDLMENLNLLDQELRAFMDGSKRAPEPQQQLPFEEPAKEKVTKIKIEPGMTSAGSALPPADPDAMARVAEGDGIKKKGGRPKKVAQSAQHPSGQKIVEEEPLQE